MLTFLDWENYLDDQGNARTIEWSLSAMRGASAYPYVIAVYQSAEYRGTPWQAAIADVRAGQVEIANASSGNLRNDLLGAFQTALLVARNGVVQSSLNYLPVGTDSTNWANPSVSLSATNVGLASALLPPLQGGDVATQEEKQLILDLYENYPLLVRGVMGKFGGMAAALLAIKHVLQTMTRKVQSPFYSPSVAGTVYTYERAGQGVSYAAAQSDFLGSTSGIYPQPAGYENFSYEFVGRPQGSEYLVYNHGFSFTGNLPVSHSDINNPKAVPYSLVPCKLIEGPFSGGVFSCNTYGTLTGEPPFVFIDQVLPSSTSHTWDQKIGFSSTFPDHPFPTFVEDGNYHGHRETFLWVKDFDYPL